MFRRNQSIRAIVLKMVEAKIKTAENVYQNTCKLIENHRLVQIKNVNEEATKKIQLAQDEAVKSVVGNFLE